MTVRTAGDRLARLVESTFRDRLDPASPIAWRLSEALADYAHACRREDEKIARQDARGIESSARFGRTKANIERVLGRRPS